MKEIKFRSVHVLKSNNKVSHFSFWGFLDSKDNQLFTPPESIPNTYRIDDQYIRHKDKEGKEIYEGSILDVCRHEDEENIFRVLIEDIGQLPEEMFGPNMTWRKVMGNIYENPELLT